MGGSDRGRRDLEEPPWPGIDMRALFQLPQWKTVRYDQGQLKRWRDQLLRGRQDALLRPRQRWGGPFAFHRFVFRPVEAHDCEEGPFRRGEPVGFLVLAGNSFWISSVSPPPSPAG